MTTRATIAGLALAALASAPALALDICPVYGKVDAQINDLVKSGVPFELLSIAVDEAHHDVRKIVRIAYDLWDELATVEIIGGAKTRVPLPATKAICAAISFPAASGALKYSYKLLLNPGLNSRFKHLRSDPEEHGNRLLKVDWDSVLKEYETERVLLEHEFVP